MDKQPGMVGGLVGWFVGLVRGLEAWFADLLVGGLYCELVD